MIDKRHPTKRKEAQTFQPKISKLFTLKDILFIKKFQGNRNPLF